MFRRLKICADEENHIFVVVIVSRHVSGIALTMTPSEANLTNSSCTTLIIAIVVNTFRGVSSPPVAT
jgi:hypothetical protein